MSNIDEPHKKVRESDPLTSRDAAAKQTRANSEIIREHIVRLLKLYGPMTDEEIEARYRTGREAAPSLYPNASPSGLRSRRSELRAEGYVRATAEKRPTRLGMASIVWEAVTDADQG